MADLDILGFLLWYFAFLFSITVHEAAHAWAALRGGDPTAYQGGQVTLNPLPHIRREPLGTVVVPLFTFFSRGWMMGWASAPFDPRWARGHPRRAALMAAAGPAANLVVVLLAFVVLKVLLQEGVVVVPWRWDFTRLVEPAAPGAAPWAHAACQLASIFLNLNLIFVCFNLLPFPPMDGYAIVSGLLRERLGGLIQAVEANPILALLGLLVAWSLFPRIFVPILVRILRLLYAGVPS